MKGMLLVIICVFVICPAFAQERANDDFGSYRETEAAIFRVLSYPSYSVADEKTLNRAGDMAALAVIRNLSVEDLNSPEKARQVLLILNLAFAKPQLIVPKAELRPTAAMFLLDYLGKSYSPRHPNEVENTRIEIQHNTSTGQPQQFLTLDGKPAPDMERTRWLSNVLSWTHEIKPGMTRKQLLRVYSEEGGISTRDQRTYVLKGCPGIKVDVQFLPVGNTKDDLTESPDDKILKISRPYLEYSTMD